ncbi:MAG: DUF2723 domain-containing protein [Myxococcota bacterium]
MKPSSLAVAVGAATALACAVTASPWVQGGDSGEMIAVAARGGVLHPPGYPLYAMLARVFAQLPFGSVAWRVSLLSAAAMGVAAGVIVQALRGMGVSGAAAASATLGLALSPLIWTYGSLPEVFALHLALAAVVVLAAVRRDAPLAGLAMGLGAANHHTLVLLLPLAILACRRRPLVAAAALLAGLTPYAYLVYQARHATPGAWVWGDAGGWHGLVRHFLRAEYGTFTLHAGYGQPGYWRHLVAYLVHLPDQTLAVGLIAGLAGLAWLPRGLRLAFGASLTLAVAFLCVFNTPVNGIMLAIAQRFWLLPTFLLAVPAAFALDRLRIRMPRIGLAALVIFPLLQAARSYPLADQRRDDTLERYVRDALAIAAQDAVIVGRGDEAVFGFLYGRAVLGLRPDVRYVDGNMLAANEWYFRRVQRDVGEVGAAFGAISDAGVVGALVSRGPVYLTRVLEVPLPLWPEGPLLRVGDPPALDQVARLNEEIFRRRPPPVGPWRPWALQVRRAYGASYGALARQMEGAGRPAEAGAWFERAHKMVVDAP